jgi:hypothetical protein
MAMHWTPIVLTSVTGSYEYLALVGSFVFVVLEAVIRVLTLALRMLKHLAACV